jgi:hypothetical protein
MRTFLLVIVLSAFCGLLSAKPKLVAATKQSWSGGVAGRSGCNYSFKLQFSKRDRIRLDSIWLDHVVFPLITGDLSMGVAGNCTVTAVGSNQEWEILVGTQHDEYASRHPTDAGGWVPPTQEPPIPVDGVACIGYSQKGVRKYLVVKAFTKVAKPQDYP